MREPIPTRRTAAAVLLFALLLSGGCGGGEDAEAHAPASADAGAPAPAPAAAPTPAEPAPGPAELVGTWRYTSWTSGGREMMNRDVFYWLTLRENGSWTLSSTTRSAPSSPDFVAWGSYTVEDGTLVLAQRNGETYARFAVRGSVEEGLTLTDLDTGDVIRLQKGRG